MAVKTTQSQNLNIAGLARGKKLLSITPLMPDCESYFTYDIEGHILPIGENAKETIRTLKLDIPKIDNLREAAISIVFVNPDGGELISVEEAQLLIHHFQQKDGEGKFEPFCVAIVNVLQQIC